jgi:hypothetical protein
MGKHVPGLAEVNDELYLDFAVSAMVGGTHEPEPLEMGLAHVAVRLVVDAQMPLEQSEEAGPSPEVEYLP